MGFLLLSPVIGDRGRCRPDHHPMVRPYDPQATDRVSCGASLQIRRASTGVRKGPPPVSPFSTFGRGPYTVISFGDGFPVLQIFSNARCLFLSPLRHLGSRQEIRGAGGPHQSKWIKIEALAMLGHGDYPSSSQVRPLTSVVVASMGSGSTDVVPKSLGGGGPRSKYSSGNEGIVKDRTLSVCDYASVSAPDALVEFGTNLADLAGSSHEVKHLDVVEGGDRSPLVSNVKVMKEVSKPTVGLVEAIGSSASTMVPISDPLELASAGRNLTGNSGLGCSILAMLSNGDIAGSQAVCLIAGVKATVDVDGEQYLALEFDLQLRV